MSFYSEMGLKIFWTNKIYKFSMHCKRRYPLTMKINNKLSEKLVAYNKGLAFNFLRIHC